MGSGVEEPEGQPAGSYGRAGEAAGTRPDGALLHGVWGGVGTHPVREDDVRVLPHARWPGGCVPHCREGRRPGQQVPCPLRLPDRPDQGPIRLAGALRPEATRGSVLSGPGGSGGVRRRSPVRQGDPGRDAQAGEPSDHRLGEAAARRDQGSPRAGRSRRREGCEGSRRDDGEEGHPRPEDQGGHGQAGRPEPSRL